MVTREFLLNNGFDFRVWEGSTSPCGEYTKRFGGDKFITIGYDSLFKWNYEIKNCKMYQTFSADCQNGISVKKLQELTYLAGIAFTFKTSDSGMLSDFRRSVDFAILFNFSDNDFWKPMSVAAELYCDEFNDQLQRIDRCADNDRDISGYVADFNKICEIESVKEIMKCGFMSSIIKDCSASLWRKAITSAESSFNQMRRHLDYIPWNGKRKIYEYVDGKYVVVEEIDRFITGTCTDISASLPKYGTPNDNPAGDKMFPFWCNGEVLILYMKDGHLTYDIL